MPEAVAALPRIRSAEFCAGAKNESELPPPVLVEVAFAGRSNVGKSSLINTLVERKNLVRTSSTPGCTRQISFFDVHFTDDSALTLVDLPGFGYAKRSKDERNSWADVIEAYLLGRPTLRAVVSIVDVRRGLEPDDRDLHELLRSPSRVNRPPVSVIVVATKLDKLPRSKQKIRARARSRGGGPGGHRFLRGGRDRKRRGSPPTPAGGRSRRLTPEKAPLSLLCGRRRRF